MDFFTALRALSSFDHRACNQMLYQRHIELSVPRTRGGGSGAYEPQPLVDLGFPLLFVVAAISVSVFSYVRRETYTGSFRRYYIVGPIVALFGLGILSLGVRVVTDYASACTALLHRAP